MPPSGESPPPPPPTASPPADAAETPSLEGLTITPNTQIPNTQTRLTYLNARPRSLTSFLRPSTSTIRPSPSSYLAALSPPRTMSPPPPYSLLPPTLTPTSALPPTATPTPSTALPPTATPTPPSVLPPTPPPPSARPPTPPPSSYHRAQRNRLTPSHLAALTATTAPTKPLFLYNALTLPKQLSHLLHNALSSSEIAELMTPATLHGYERLAVKGADFPAIVAVEGVQEAENAEESPSRMNWGMVPGLEGATFVGVGAAGKKVKKADRVTGTLVFLPAAYHERVDEEEVWLFAVAPVQVEVVTMEPLSINNIIAVRPVLVDAETYVWDGLRASLYEREEKEWSIEEYLGSMMGWGMDEDGEEGEGEVDVWGVDGMDAGGGVEGDGGMLIPHERWFGGEDAGGSGEGGEGSGGLYEGLFGLD